MHEKVYELICRSLDISRMVATLAMETSTACYKTKSFSISFSQSQPNYMNLCVASYVGSCF